MATPASVLSAAIVGAVRTAPVATAAGYDATAWASTTVPHVFDNAFQGFVGGRNRGRCPFVEVDVQSQRFSRDNVEGGMLTTTVRLRIHAAKRNSGDLLMAIAIASFAAIRGLASGYTALGDDQIGDPVAGPLGWVLDATMTFEHSWARSTYEAS